MALNQTEFKNYLHDAIAASVPAALTTPLKNTFIALFKKPIDDNPDAWQGDQGADQKAQAMQKATDQSNLWGQQVTDTVAAALADSLSQSLSEQITAYLKTADVVNIRTQNDAGVRLIDTLVPPAPTANGSLLTAAALYPVAGTIGDNILATATQTNKGNLE